jgi:hypothetical protein
MTMGVNDNGATAGSDAGARQASSDRRPRRLVLLGDGEDSEVRQVLAEYPAGGVKGSQLHAELQRLAGEHPGVLVAAEWLGPLGWTRFLWCRRPSAG